MKTISTIILSLLLFTTGIFAQDDSDWQEKEYQTGDFTGIHVQGGFRLHLIQGDEAKVIVKSPDSDVFDHLRVKDRGNRLNIYRESEKFEFDRVALYITFKNLENLYFEGGVKLRTHGYIDLKDIDIHLEGGAKINMNLKAENIYVTGEGGTFFNFKGVANSLNVNLLGAGHVNAEELKVKDASVKIEGVGTSSVYATENLDVKIEGVGKVTYSGTPRVTRNIEGLGSVKKKN